MSDLSKRIENLPPEKLSLLIRELKKKNNKKHISTEIGERDNKNIYPMSFAQKRLWFFHQLQPDSQFYNIPAVLYLTGKLNLTLFKKSVLKIISRHEVLRSYFPEINGEPVQKLHSIENLRFNFSHYEEKYPVDQRNLNDLIIKYSTQKFNLKNDFLIHLHLLRLSDDEHILFLTLHHIVADGWSIKIFAKELTELYESYINNKDALLPSLTIQYADYAEWQNKNLNNGKYDAQLNFWMKKLEGMPHALELPLDYPRPKTQTFVGNKFKFNIEEELSSNVKNFSSRESITPFMLLLSTLQILLYRFTSQLDFGIGIPFANRNSEEIKNTIGFFINTLVIRSNLSPNFTVKKTLSNLRQFIIEAVANADMPFEKVVESMISKRDLSISPLFQVMFDYLENPIKMFQIGDIKIEKLNTESNIAKFDLMLSVEDNGNNFECAFEYNIDLFNPDTIENLAHYYKELLLNLIKSPEQKISTINIFSQSELEKIYAGSVQKLTPYPRNSSIHKIFENNLEENKYNLAVEYKDQKLKFLELNEKANKLANYLIQLGITNEAVVGVCLERSIESIICILGIWKSGAAYLPLDPEYPDERLNLILRDSNTELLITEKHLVNRLTAKEINSIYLSNEWERISEFSEKNPSVKVDSENLAYTIYTSGSTGSPKGVMIQHCSALNLAYALKNKIYSKYPDQKLRISLNAPFQFDASMQEILMLIFGHSLILIPEEIRLDGNAFLSYLRSKRIDLLDCVPSQLKLLIEHGLLDSNEWHPRIILPGGEPIDTIMWDKLKESTHITFFNMYGPTECTVDSTICEISEGFAKPSIGSSIDNVSHYILNEDVSLVPFGMPGELYIGGECLARGYLGRPDLTAERFLPDPFGKETGGRIYKTGDSVRAMKDGNYEYIRRLDDQVKLRGYRIELGEIEALIKQHEIVNEAIVLINNEGTGPKRLVAYVFPENNRNIDFTVLKNYIASFLPDYMIPSAFIQLDKIPLLPNGKINKKGLPDPGLYRDIATDEYRPPQTSIEKVLANIWEKLLTVENVGIKDNFFQIGGDSINAAILTNKIRTAFNISLNVKTVFEYPTIEELAIKLESDKKKQRSMAKDENRNKFEKVIGVEKSNSLELSYAQERLWFLDNIENNNQYNISGGVKIIGNLDYSVLEKCLIEITNRHDTLRMAVDTIGGKPAPVLLNDYTLNLQIMDYSNYADKETASKIDELIAQVISKKFNMNSGPLAEYWLVKTAEDEYYFILNMHHIISDGWSIGIFLKEFKILYESSLLGAEAPLNDIRIQYSDYANWQRNLFENHKLDDQIEYWKNQLASIPEYLDFPTDLPRPPIQSMVGEKITFRIEESLFNRINECCMDLNITKFMFLLANFNVLLSKYVNDSDIFVGIPVNGRSREEFEPLIGMFVNTLLIRNDLSGNPKFCDLTSKIKETLLDAFANQDLPFQKLVDIVKPERNLSISPLFQHMFVYNVAELENFKIDGISIEHINIDNKSSKFDFTLEVTEYKNSFLFCVEYNTDLFLRSTIENFLNYFIHIIEEVLDDPSRSINQLRLFSEIEQSKLISHLNETEQISLLDFPISQTFTSVARDNYNKTAIRANDKSYSYSDLESESNKLANFLRNLGVGNEAIVGVCIPRSFDLITSLIGILKSGGAYLPIDPNFPLDRIQYILTDSETEFVITVKRLTYLFDPNKYKIIILDEIVEDLKRESDKNPNIEIYKSNLCYVIYTSGSTGIPKGTLITHEGLLNYLSFTHHMYPFNTNNGSMVLSTISFDATVTSIFPSLLHGKVIVLADEDAEIDELAKEVEKSEKFSIIKLTPSHLEVLSNLLDKDKLSKITEALIVGGENLTTNQIKAWQNNAPDLLIYNEYGPTEAVVGCIVYEATKYSGIGSVPIGKVIPNMQIYVLDRSLSHVPKGVAGELYLGGVSLARGYLNKPDLTAENFVPNPFAKNGSERIYKTGDLVKIQEDGNLIFLGRIDDQVKVRGYRIELGEIKRILDQYAKVQDSVVLYKEINEKVNSLIAFIVSEENIKENISEIKNHAARYLPSYMIPNHFVQIEKIPLTKNGKLDKNKLLLIDITDHDKINEFVAPATDNEKILTEIWNRVLGLDRISINENFFELGGDSILGIQVISQANKAGISLSAKDLFQFPTIKSLSTAGKSKNNIVAEQGELTGNILLTPVQKWFFLENMIDMNHWNQSLLLNVNTHLDIEILKSAIKKILEHHDALRIRFELQNGNWTQKYSPVEADVPLIIVDLSNYSSNEKIEKIELESEKEQKSLNITAGPMFKCIYFSLGNNQSDRMLIIAHHLVMDTVSWRILLEDFQKIYRTLENEGKVILPKKTTSYKTWAERLNGLLDDEKFLKENQYWSSIKQQGEIANSRENIIENTENDASLISDSLNKEMTELLLKELPKKYNTDMNDILLTALVLTNSRVNGTRKMVIALEGHGREDLFDDVDISNTIGWFTSIYPVQLDLENSSDRIGALKTIKEQLRKIPNNGIGYGVLKYLWNDSDKMGDLPHLPDISFNYLGQFNHISKLQNMFSIAEEYKGSERSELNKRPFQIDISGSIYEGILKIDWLFNPNKYSKQIQQEFVKTYLSELKEIINSVTSSSGAYTPSDFNEVELDDNELESIFSELNDGIDDE